MSLIDIAPLPMNAPLLQVGPDGKSTDYLSSDYYQTFFAIISRLQSTAQVASDPITAIDTQSASIAATPLPIGDVVGGVYRVSWYARITRAATTSSSLTVTIGWTQGGLGLTSSGAAITGNTTSTTQSGNILVNADPSSPFTYATTYASVGGTTMQYTLTVVAEYLGA